MRANMLRDTDKEKDLPSPEERRRIIEHARQVLVEARAMLELLDQVQGKLPPTCLAERPGRERSLAPAVSALGHSPRTVGF